MYNLFSNKPLRIKKFSFKNLIFFLLLVIVVMGFHVWIVVKTLTILDDVSSVIILKRGKLLAKHLPDTSIQILVRDSDWPPLRSSMECCATRNCVLLDDKCYSDDDFVTFDAIMYGQNTLKDKRMKNRLEKIKNLNIFASISPPDNITCDVLSSDNFFHLTFTHRLDSDIVLKQFVVRDFSGEIIAPGISPPWNTNLTTIFDGVKSLISSKNKPVVYLSYDELEDSKGTHLTKLKKSLSEHALKIDRYNCSDDWLNDTCSVILPDIYYFYIIFENYFAEDYVTDRILRAYENYVVPIIFGGANYTRFLPPNSYIDGRLTDPREIVSAIRDSINNLTRYEEYFKWRSLYTIERYEPFCDLCNALNSRSKNLPAKRDFRKWWYGEEEVRRCLSPKGNTTDYNTKATTSITTKTNSKRISTT